MTFLSFEQWMAENVDLLDDIYDEKNGTECCDCEGTGEVICDTCDRDGAECQTCEGDGRIIGSQAYRHAEQTMKNIYDQRLKSDQRKLDEWNKLVAS